MFIGPSRDVGHPHSPQVLTPSVSWWGQVSQTEGSNPLPKAWGSSKSTIALSGRSGRSPINTPATAGFYIARVVVDGMTPLDRRVGAIVQQVAGVYCSLFGHNWQDVRMNVGRSREGFTSPVVWNPTAMCRRCGAFQAEVGFPVDSNGTRSGGAIEIDSAESSTVIISGWGSGSSRGRE